MSALTENDMSQYDLDAPFEAQLETNGHRSSLENFLKAAKGSGKTLRELAEEHSNSCLDLDGTPESVASQMDEVMQEIGGDGFLLTAAWTRRQIADITEGLVPELQRRGLVRTEYTYPDLRSNLFEY
jgi:alkanesulfonate monooxygenase SsuD/methylene tetrahydromethanopterin reductase-like flavin-dependent oxidoreductase (luciferase family)